MEKFAIASTASKDVVKRLIDDLETSQYDLSEARDKINKGFEDLKKDQDALATRNGGINVDGSEILDINVGGGRDVCDQGHPDPYKGEEDVGSVQWEVVQTSA